VPEVEVGQADFGAVYLLDKFCNGGDDFFFLGLGQLQPVGGDKIRQGRAVNFLGDDEGFFLQAEAHLLPKTNRVIGVYALLEQYVYIFPFTGRLRAEAAEIADGKEHVLEVRLEKTLHKEFFLAAGGVKRHRDNFSFVVFVYGLAGGELEEILKRYEAGLLENLRPVFCKFDFYHS